ncbi:MAG: Fic family protein [Solobacterium sp.]|nr:Fic family protein [Solobacterium sp.]
MKTGVEDWIFTKTPLWLGLVGDARRNEQVLKEKRPAESRLKQCIAEGCMPLKEAAEDDAATLEQFAEMCLEKTPGEAEMRRMRDVRERVRMLYRLREGVSLPGTEEDLLSLWKQANDGENTKYGDGPVTYRKSGDPLPFAQKNPSGGPDFVPEGCETTAPDQIMIETRHLLAFLKTEEEPELKACAVFFLAGRIHSFRDGNGHLLRMLVIGILSSYYGIETLLAFLQRLQINRPLISEEERNTNHHRKDLSEVGILLMRLLILSQKNRM